VPLYLCRPVRGLSGPGPAAAGLLSYPRSEVSGAPGGPRTVVLFYVYGRTVTMPRRYDLPALVRAVGGHPLRPLSRWTCSCRRSSARQAPIGADDRW